MGGAGSKGGVDQEQNPLPLSNQSLLLLLVLANLTDGPDWPNPYRQAITCFRNTQGRHESGVCRWISNVQCVPLLMYSSSAPLLLHRRHVVAIRGAASLLPDQFQQSVHGAVRAAAVRPGHAAALHPAAPELQHEDVHALQDRHGQPGG